jgi:hypothetical protein
LREQQPLDFIVVRPFRAMMLAGFVGMTALDVMLICPRGNERGVRRHRQRECRRQCGKN